MVKVLAEEGFVELEKGFSSIGNLLNRENYLKSRITRQTAEAYEQGFSGKALEEMRFSRSQDSQTAFYEAAADGKIGVSYNAEGNGVVVDFSRLLPTTQGGSRQRYEQVQAGFVDLVQAAGVVQGPVRDAHELNSPKIEISEQEFQAIVSGQTRLSPFQAGSHREIAETVLRSKLVNSTSR